MNLDSKRNVVLCRKYILVAQIALITKLEKMRQTALKKAPEDKRDEINEYFLKAKEDGNIDFIDAKNLSIGENLTKKLATYASLYNEFNAFTYLGKAVEGFIQEDENGEKVVDPNATRKFDKIINRNGQPKMVKDFGKDLLLHSPTYLGHEYFMTKNKLVDSLAEYSNHGLTISPTVLKSLDSEQFGPGINGITSMDEVLRKSQARDNMIPDLISGIQSLDSIHKDKQYAKETNKFIEGLYIAGNMTGRYIATNLSGKILPITTAAVILAGSLFAYNTIKNGIEFNHPEQTYQTMTQEQREDILGLSPDTINLLNKIQDEITTMQSSPTIPTAAELDVVHDELDTVITHIYSDKITESFIEAHPDAKNVVVSNFYNYTNSDDPQNGVTISYDDKNGTHHTESITDFKKPILGRDIVTESNTQEAKLDANGAEIQMIGNKDYNGNAKDVTNIIKDLDNILDTALDLTNYQFTCTEKGVFIFKKDVISISTYSPEDNQNTQTDEEVQNTQTNIGEGR